jgi:CHAT domain-containing protein
MERSKSAVLLASVRNLNALKSSDVPANIMQLEKQLNEEINGLRQLLADEKQKQSPAIDKISFFETKLLSLLLEHDSLVDKLEENYPKYYALKYDRSTIQLPLLIEKIRDNEAIIEYEIADSAIYIYAITRNGIMIRDTRIDSTFWNSLNYLLTVKNVDISEFRKSEIRQFYEHSNRIWKQLIEPVCHFVKEKKLIIIPDGVLGYLPFEVLARTTEHPEKLTFKTMPYLLNEFPVSYSYSSTLKYNPYFARKAVNNHELIAFAPDYGKDNENASRTRNLIFDKLPNAKQEVVSIEEMWGGKLYLGNSATKSNFIKKAGNYNVIHLAMHALINDSVPMFSKLVFSDIEDDTASYFLNTYEIYDLVLNASMVTLSACNTGTGILRNGEGIMSLARGFIYAGVPSIIMTLWEVQDKSGSDIMTSYYRNLTRGDAKDVALQNAKLKFLKDSPDYGTHPFYWSAYIVTGDTQPIKSSKLPFIYSSGIAVILVLIALISWFIIRHKKRSGKTI